MQTKDGKNGWMGWEGRMGGTDEDRVGCSDGRVNDVALLGGCSDWPKGRFSDELVAG